MRLLQNQTNTKRSRKIFYNLSKFVFEYFQNSSTILVSFAKFFLKVLFATRSYHYPNPKCVIQYTFELPSLSHTCIFDMTNLYKPLPQFTVFLAQTKSPNLCTETKCFSEILQQQLGAGKDFVKICHLKKHVWEWEGSASMRWMTGLGLG